MKLPAVFAVASFFIQMLPNAIPRQDVSKIFENEAAIAWDGQFIKDWRTPLHQHQLDLATYFLTAGRVDVTLRDGVTTPGEPFPAGRALFQPGGLIHMEEYKTLGTRAIGLELKDGIAASAPISADLDPVKIGPATHRTLVDNPRVRIIETRLGGADSRVRHAHPPRLVVEPAVCTALKAPASAVILDGGVRVWWAEAEQHADDLPPLGQSCRRIEFEVRGGPRHQ